MQIPTGTLVDEVVIDIERGKIGEFVRATAVTDRVHTDAEAAAAAGFAALPATATHVVVTGHQRDQHAFVHALGLDITRVVVGSVSWTFERPLVAGDRLTARRTVVDDGTKVTRSGTTNRLVTLETAFVTSEGEVAARQREVLIERGRA
jgi:acyl dehydratase